MNCVVSFGGFDKYLDRKLVSKVYIASKTIIDKPKLSKIWFQHV